MIDESLLLHPTNRRWFESQFADVRRGAKGMTTADYWSYSIPVRYSSFVPERDIREEWHPPLGRFVEYESSDEAWMRPLGLGLVSVDRGPLILRCRTPNIFDPLGLVKFSSMF